MKKLIVVLGLIGAVILAIGVFFKMMHWPGAAVAVLLGAVLLFCYSLTLLFTQLKGVGDNMSKVFVFFFGLTGALLSIAFLFKMLHWPGAGFLIYSFYVSYILLLIACLFRIVQEKDSEKQFWYINYLIWLVGGLLMLTFPIIMRIFEMNS